MISPLLSNIFLHYVLDEWFAEVVKPWAKGRCFLVRFADDFIIGCELERDAQGIMKSLPKRFERYGLSLHPDKTAMIQFRKPERSNKGESGNGTFDFLGFTFYWERTRFGYWVIKKKIARKRLRRFMKGLWKWCRENRHDHISEQYKTLSAKLRGYYQYYGVRSNYGAIAVVYEFAKKAWKFWLSRRSSKGGISWEKFKKLLAIFKLPKPRIVQNI